MTIDNQTVIIPAGGNGIRLKNYLQGQSKQFVKINNKPVLELVINKFFDFIPIRELVISLPELDFEGNYDYYSKKFPTIKIVKGGETRQESVHNALKSLKFNTGKVIIHDAVRPFFTKNELMAVILKAEEKGNAILAVRAKDTVRMVRNNISEGILDREKIYLVQTPQVFDLKILNEVYEKSKIINFVGTDDAMLLEHYGYEIYIVEGGYQNFKITSSFDFKVAQYLADFENLEDLF
jgi:2-C-methyl-D-erythritol 4-phosphate cytidylyltransferase